MGIKTSNTHYSLLSIKVLIVILFIVSLIVGSMQVVDYYDYSGSAVGMSSFLDLFIHKSYFRPAAFLAIPTMGVFLKKKTGWVLMISYFYFLITNVLYRFTMDYTHDYKMILFYVVISSLVVVILVVMNKKNIYSSKYHIQGENLILSNIIAFVIGVSITIYLSYARG